MAKKKETAAVKCCFEKSSFQYGLTVCEKKKWWLEKKTQFKKEISQIMESNCEKFVHCKERNNEDYKNPKNGTFVRIYLDDSNWTREKVLVRISNWVEPVFVAFEGKRGVIRFSCESEADYFISLSKDMFRNCETSKFTDEEKKKYVSEIEEKRMITIAGLEELIN